MRNKAALHPTQACHSAVLTSHYRMLKAGAYEPQKASTGPSVAWVLSPTEQALQSKLFPKLTSGATWQQLGTPRSPHVPMQGMGLDGGNIYGSPEPCLPTVALTWSVGWEGLDPGVQGGQRIAFQRGPYRCVSLGARTQGQPEGWARGRSRGHPTPAHLQDGGQGRPGVELQGYRRPGALEVPGGGKGRKSGNRWQRHLTVIILSGCYVWRSLGQTDEGL